MFFIDIVLNSFYVHAYFVVVFVVDGYIIDIKVVIRFYESTSPVEVVIFAVAFALNTEVATYVYVAVFSFNTAAIIGLVIQSMIYFSKSVMFLEV